MSFKPLIAYATALAFLSATLPAVPAYAGGRKPRQKVPGASR